MGARTNRPVVTEPPWDSPRTRELAVRACFARHSSQTVWPWCFNIAPVSWRLPQYVDTWRRKVNFSGWNRPQTEASNATETVIKGATPAWDYTLVHPPARLSPAGRAGLIRGLTATFGTGGGGAAPPDVAGDFRFPQIVHGPVSIAVSGP